MADKRFSLKVPEHLAKRLDTMRRRVRDPITGKPPSLAKFMLAQLAIVVALDKEKNHGS